MPRIRCTRRILLRAGLNFVTGGTFDDGAATKFLWVESRISPTPEGHRVGEVGLNTIGLTLGTNYDRVNAAELASVNFSNYTAIVVASTFGGLLGQDELNTLSARKVDIASFVNLGGGVFAMAECDNSPTCQGDLVSDPSSVFAWLPVVVSSVAANAPFTVTPFGAGLGLTNDDVNDPTHNSFGLTGGLNVVDNDVTGIPTNSGGQCPHHGRRLRAGAGAALARAVWVRPRRARCAEAQARRLTSLSKLNRNGGREAAVSIRASAKGDYFAPTSILSSSTFTIRPWIGRMVSGLKCSRSMFCHRLPANVLARAGGWVIGWRGPL